MNITFLTTSYSRFKGDDANVPWIEDLAKELVKKGLSVKVVAPHDKQTKDVEIMDGVEVHRFKYWFTKSQQRVAYGNGGIPSNLNSLFAKFQFPFFIFFFALKAIRVVGPKDIIHAHWSLSGLIGIFVKFLRPNKVYLSIRGSGLRLTPRILMKFIVDNVDLINVDSNEYSDKIKLLGTSTETTEVRLKFINLDRYNRNLDGGQISKEFNLEEKIVITLVSYFLPTKRIDVLIKAIPNIIKHSQKEVVFLFVGDGPLYNKFKIMVNQMQISKYVVFTGIRKDINQILSASDIFVTCECIPEEGSEPTESICFSNAVLEAMAMGVPCVIPNIPYTSDYWKDGFDSLFYEPTYSSLGKAILKLINNDNMRSNISENGISFFERHKFTKERVLEGVIENYKALT